MSILSIASLPLNLDPLEKQTSGGPDVVVDEKAGGSHVGSSFFFFFDRVESLVAN